jgi:acetyl-CoA synthetase
MDVNSEPGWTPSQEFICTTNIAWLMERAGAAGYEALHEWSVRNREAYWALAIERLGIRLHRPFGRVMDLSHGVEAPAWMPGAELNIVESCLAAPADSAAIIYQSEGGAMGTMSVRELDALAGRVASNLSRRGFVPGDALAIVMPMTAECVAIYLGIIKAGCVAVSIADSFRPNEIARRLKLANTAAVFTQDFAPRAGKELRVYDNVVEANGPPAIVVPATDRLRVALRPEDCAWADFLEAAPCSKAIARAPSDPINILFSSGTTGDPKVIPWTQTTPIKCAADGHFHQNIQPGDVVVWPTNIGWMMGPWLIFAALINRATIGLYYGAPNGREFCKFVEEAKATVLGLVPSLVKAWREGNFTQGVDWSAIKVFSSTGECPVSEDMRWLMSQAGGRPVIEYCGGTEIGGAYITGAVTRRCIPGTFNTPALGLDIVILDESGEPAEVGEVFLVPPSMGLSNTLLNKDHYEVYFAGTPPCEKGEILRRHGDRMERLPGGFWRALGRADDTMNLCGIKVSSVEIEEAVQSVPGVVETAAIAVSPDGGPSKLVIYAACPGGWSKEDLAAAMQNAIRQNLNPLFKIHDVVLVEALPRTSSNKVMRRTLRDWYSSRQ